MQDLSEQYGKDFLENYKPLDQESFQQLRKTVHLVSGLSNRIIFRVDVSTVYGTGSRERAKFAML